MDVAPALDDLLEISSHVEAAVVLDEAGSVLGATVDDERASALARAGVELLARADATRPATRAEYVHAATPDGSVFAVRGDGCAVAALTAAAPTVGLVLYDLRTCLRRLRDGDDAAG